MELQVTSSLQVHELPKTSKLYELKNCEPWRKLAETLNAERCIAAVWWFPLRNYRLRPGGRLAEALFKAFLLHTRAAAIFQRCTCHQSSQTSTHGIIYLHGLASIKPRNRSSMFAKNQLQRSIKQLTNICEYNREQQVLSPEPPSKQPTSERSPQSPTRSGRLGENRRSINQYVT